MNRLCRESIFWMATLNISAVVHLGKTGVCIGDELILVSSTVRLSQLFPSSLPGESLHSVFLDKKRGGGFRLYRSRRNSRIGMQ